MNHVTLEELKAGLELIRQAPQDRGVLELIVRRPGVGAREVLAEGRLDVAEGLVGDTWRTRGSSKTPDGSADPEMQLNVMNVRVIALLGQDRSRWALAGDQLYVDLDLSAENMPPGTRLAIGSAVIAVSALPHLGCRNFAARFGAAAVGFVNSAIGKQLRLRGINAKVLQPGAIRVGDTVQKLR